MSILDKLDIALENLTSVVDGTPDKWGRMVGLLGAPSYTNLLKGYLSGDQVIIDRVDALSGENWRFYYGVLKARLEADE